jgi:hypothetical protein
VVFVEQGRARPAAQGVTADVAGRMLRPDTGSRRVWSPRHGAQPLLRDDRSDRRVNADVFTPKLATGQVGATADGDDDRHTQPTDRAALELRVGEGAYALRSVPDWSSLFFSRLKAV